MKTLTELKNNQIRIMLFTLKMLALFFSVVPLFQEFFKDVSILEISSQGSLKVLISVLFIICIVLFLWTITNRKNSRLNFFVAVEVALFFTCFIAAICISGYYASYYKFLFLFIVVSYTIEFGTIFGIIIASISSVFLLGMDLLMVQNFSVNRYFENDIALSAMFIVVAWTLGYYVQLEKRHIEQLSAMVNIDGLTQIYNHRYLHDYLKYQFEQSLKLQQPLSIIMLDIDNFKKYNDTYGHQRGDDVLKVIAYLLKTNSRSEDVVCRYGGEEFCIILPNTAKDKATELADKLRRIIYDYAFDGQEYLPGNNLTISAGIAQSEGEGDTYLNLIHNADCALYRAKFLRKNRVEVFSSIFEQFSDLDTYDKKTTDNIKTLRTLITVINSRDKYTYNHVEKVVRYCDIMANHLHLSKEDRRILIFGAYMHDLGKINTNKDTLICDGKLTPEQWAELKKHPEDGAEIINQISGFQDVVPLVLQHHERYDGTGYPSGLKGENINYLARILTIADSFDAMTTERPYKREKTIEEAFIEIKKCAGSQFDPWLAMEFVSAISEAE